MNILVINHYAGSLKHGMEYRPYYLAREWVSDGHSVLIVGASYSHIRSQQPYLVDEVATDEVIDGIGYRWFPTPVYSGNGIKRVLNIISFLKQLRRAEQSIAHNFKPDVVIASSTYPMDIWSARRIADLSQARLVFEVHDLWPLSPVELGAMSRWHPFIMWVQFAEDYAYQHAHCVISMLPKTLEYMMTRGLSPQKWSYVPNGVDVNDWNSPESLPVDVQSVLDDIRGRGLPIVSYTGTHGLANALDLLLDAANLLRGKVQVLLVGTGPERIRLQKRVYDEQLDNVVMLSPIPKSAIPSLLSQIDIAYIGWHPNPLYRFGISPNKLMDYMMAGKPVVHAVKAGNDPVADAKCGISIEPGNAEAVANAILSLASMTQRERREIGQRGRDFVLENHSYPVLAKKFIKSIFKTNESDGSQNER